MARGKWAGQNFFCVVQIIDASCHSSHTSTPISPRHGEKMFFGKTLRCTVIVCVNMASNGETTESHRIVDSRLFGIEAVGRRYKLGERTVARWVAKFDHYGTSCPLKKRAKQGFSSLEPAHTEFILEHGVHPGYTDRCTCGLSRGTSASAPTAIPGDLYAQAGPRCSGCSRHHAHGAGVKGNGAEQASPRPIHDPPYT
jgi:hypothetical protein